METIPLSIGLIKLLPALLMALGFKLFQVRLTSYIKKLTGAGSADSSEKGGKAQPSPLKAKTSQSAKVEPAMDEPAELDESLDSPPELREDAVLSAMAAHDEDESPSEKKAPAKDPVIDALQEVDYTEVSYPGTPQVNAHGMQDASVSAQSAVEASTDVDTSVSPAQFAS